MEPTDSAVTPPPSGPAPGTPEYNAAMIAKAQGTEIKRDGEVVHARDATPPAAKADDKPAAPAKPQKPDGIPDKFWDAEKGEVRVADLAKSYTELERSRSQQPPKPETQAPTMGEANKPADGTPPAADPNAAKPPAAPTPEQRDAARAAATKDFQANGKLSDATYKQLADAGYSKAEVDSYIAGQTAIAQMFVNSIYETAGGKEAFDKMLAWGPTAMSPDEVKAFNSAINSGDASTAKLAVNGLKARYTAEFGKAGNLVKPNAGEASGAATGAYSNSAQMAKDMADPRYQKDPTFRAEVARKIAAASAAGVDLGLNVIIDKR